MAKCLFIANYWAADYKLQLFNQLYSQYKDMKVLYIAETEAMREWKIDKAELHFPYEIMFKGRIDDVRKFSAMRKLWGKLNDENADVLIIGGYSYFLYWIGFFWAKIKGKKVILWSSSNIEDRNRSFVKEKLKSFLVRRCDAANVYGTRNRDYLVKLGMDKKRIFIKGQTTNNEFYYNETANFKVNKSLLCKQLGTPQKNFLFVGRFSPEKNILNLLKAYKQLSDECKETWGLILVGGGPQKAEIELFIKNNALQNVLLPGFKQKNEMPKFMAISDVFILSSISETWGLVVNEAMASGLPVLVSRRCGCYPDLIREGFNGYSFDPLNVQEMFELMRNFVVGKYDSKAMGVHSVEIIQDYTPEKAAGVIINTMRFVTNEYK